jgi:cytidylate kinase
MHPRDTSEHSLAETLVKAEARRKAEAGTAAPPAFTIALSREVGARGTTVARAVGARLGWPVYDHELLERLAEEMKTHVSALERMDEQHANPMQEFFEAFTASAGVSEPAYVRRLVAAMRSLAAKGACVLVGRGAAHLLPTRTTLRVRLLGDREDRVALIARERGLSPQEAARYVEEKARARNRFIQDHFRQDPTDPQHYDLILNSSRFSDTECAELIVEALRRLQARAEKRVEVAPSA